jgi:hypothetical protein
MSRLVRIILFCMAALPVQTLSAEEATGLRGDPAAIADARKEPVIWATTQYIYVFGPLARFGSLKVPNWATTSDGLVRYEMVSLTGSPKRPELSRFAPPE